MDNNRFLAILERLLMSQGSVAGKDLRFSRSLERHFPDVRL